MKNLFVSAVMIGALVSPVVSYADDSESKTKKSDSTRMEPKKQQTHKKGYGKKRPPQDVETPAEEQIKKEVELNNR